MEYIPYINITKNTLYYNQHYSTTTTYTELTGHLPSTTPLYIYDHDGITHNKPHFNTYQRLASRYTLWIDAGPRNLGDIVDHVMAGAQHLIIRPSLIPSQNIPSIKDLTDTPLYLLLRPTTTSPPPYTPDITGYLITNETNTLQHTHTTTNLITTITKKNYPIYLFEPYPTNIPHWKHKNLTRIITTIPYLKKEHKL